MMRSTNLNAQHPNSNNRAFQCQKNRSTHYGQSVTMRLARSQAIGLAVAVATVLFLIAIVVPVTKKRPQSLSSSNSNGSGTIPTVRPSGIPAPPFISPPVSPPPPPVSNNPPIAAQQTPPPVASPVATGAPIVSSSSPPAGSAVALQLIDARTNSPLVELTDGAVVDVATLASGSTAWNVQATKRDPGVAGVRFVETGRQETNEPFSFCGDSGGDYNDCSELSLGSNTVTVVPYTSNNVEIGSLSVTFELIDSSIPPGRWIEIDSAAPIDARHEACFVMVDNPAIGRRGYLVGGRGDRALDIFDPVTRTWTTGATVPLQLHHMQCVQAQGKLWIVAAWTAGFPREENPEFMYVVSSMRWSLLELIQLTYLQTHLRPCHKYMVHRNGSPRGSSSWRSRSRRLTG